MLTPRRPLSIFELKIKNGEIKNADNIAGRYRHF
jgi:hypothetical protein